MIFDHDINHQIVSQNNFYDNNDNLIQDNYNSLFSKNCISSFPLIQNESLIYTCSTENYPINFINIDKINIKYTSIMNLTKDEYGNEKYYNNFIIRPIDFNEEFNKQSNSLPFGFNIVNCPPCINLAELINEFYHQYHANNERTLINLSKFLSNKNFQIIYPY
jgi:hypothetical protein